MGVIAVRNESVRLSLQDDFTSGMARATAAASVFGQALDGLDGKRVSRELVDTSRSIDRVGDSARRGGPDIDRFSGRMRLLTDAAVTLGPALIPLSAAAIPALTSALAGLGSAAGGIGVTVLALQGVGDALDALDTYQLEPTAENLQALRLQMEQLGPAGANFVRFLDGLEPQLKEIQNAAREGLFPGVEDGITALLERLPQVREIVSQLALGMGDLARETGEGLASDRFSAFFDYIESDARPTLESFGQSIGNVAEGLANLLVAFAPLTRDFTQGLEHATASFAEWSRGLQDNQGFQEFLGYIRRSGPQALEFLSALASALGGFVRAAAPVGSAVLPALTALARAFAAIANSPIGPPLYAAAAGLLAFNRAAKATTAITAALNGAAGFSAVGGAAATLQQKLVLLGTGGAAAALGLGTLSDGLNELDSRGRSGDTIDATVKSLQDLQDTVSYSNLGKYADDLHINLARLTEDLAANGEQGEYVNEVLGKLGDSSHGFSALLQAEAGHVLPFYTDSASKAYDAAKDLRTILGDVGDGIVVDPTEAAGLERLGTALHSVGDEARDLSGALAELQGWFDKRAAIRNYRDSLDDLKKALKGAFTREDAATLDAFGESIIQVADSIKDPALKSKFLAGARAQLEEFAATAKGKAHRQVERLLTVLDQLDVANAKPKADLEDKASPKVDDLMGKLRRYSASNPKTKVSADTAAADAAFARLQRFQFAPKVISVRVEAHGASSGGGLPEAPLADGGTVPGERYPYADKTLIYAAPGEEVISNRHGEADRYRADRAAGRIPAYADGGSVSLYTSRQPSTPVATDRTSNFHALNQAAGEAASGLKGLKARLEESEKALDKQKQRVESINSAMESLSSSVTSKFDVDLGARSSYPWAAGGGLQAMIDEATRQASAFPAIIAALQAAGLKGPALTEALQEMDFGQLQALAANPAQASQLGTALGGLYSAQQLAGGAAAGIYGPERAAELKELREIRNEVRKLRAESKHRGKENKEGHEQTAAAAAGVHNNFATGHRRGQRGPR